MGLEGDEEIDIPREEKDTTRFMPIDKPEKSPYGYAEEQIKMLNGIKLHEAGFKGEGYACGRGRCRFHERGSDQRI